MREGIYIYISPYICRYTRLSCVSVGACLCTRLFSFWVHQPDDIVFQRGFSTVSPSCCSSPPYFQMELAEVESEYTAGLQPLRLARVYLDTGSGAQASYTTVRMMGLEIQCLGGRICSTLDCTCTHVLVDEKGDLSRVAGYDRMFRDWPQRPKVCCAIHAYHAHGKRLPGRERRGRFKREEPSFSLCCDAHPSFPHPPPPRFSVLLPLICHVAM